MQVLQFWWSGSYNYLPIQFYHYVSLYDLWFLAGAFRLNYKVGGGGCTVWWMVFKGTFHYVTFLILILIILSDLVKTYSKCNMFFYLFGDEKFKLKCLRFTMYIFKYFKDFQFSYSFIHITSLLQESEMKPLFITNLALGIYRPHNWCSPGSIMHWFKR